MALQKTPLLDHQTNKELIHLPLCLFLNYCTIDFHYFTSPSNVSPSESKYRGNHKTHLLCKYLIVIGQGLYHAKVCSSLCSCGLPTANWRKS